jgi:hypothetical protein
MREEEGDIFSPARLRGLWERPAAKPGDDAPASSLPDARPPEPAVVVLDAFAAVATRRFGLRAEGINPIIDRARDLLAEQRTAENQKKLIETLDLLEQLYGALESVNP